MSSSSNLYKTNLSGQNYEHMDERSKPTRCSTSASTSIPASISASTSPASLKSATKYQNNERSNEKDDESNTNSVTVAIESNNKTSKTFKSLVKSYSEGDLRILSNPHHSQEIIPCSNTSLTSKDDGNGNSNYPTIKIGGIRSDYMILEAASKCKQGQYKKKNGLNLNSFRKRLISQQHSSICDTKKDKCSMGTNTIVVVPSIDLDGQELKRIGSAVEIYEERQLYHLLLLSDPTFRIIFLSTHSLNQDIVRYYLSLDKCSTTELNERLSRLFLLSPGPSCDENSSQQALPLSSKLVNDQKLISTIREIVNRVSYGTFPSAGLNVFCGSNFADDLASQLKLRLLEASAHTLYYGSKQGSREIFRLCCVPHAQGTPDIGDEDLLTNLPNASLCGVENHKFIRSPKALAIGIARQIILKNVKPAKWMIKLNQGFSGKGNATLDLQDIQNKRYTDASGCLLSSDSLISYMANDIENKLPEMRFECSSASWNGNEYTGYRAQIKRLGVIAEAFLEGENLSSPSVQAVIEPDYITGEHCVHMLSTHEQILDGQIYHGCVNPASEHYRKHILDHTKKIGFKLADRGVVGHFAADFLATCNHNDEGEKTYDVYAIEINLRQGGTTHPFATLALLTGGDTDDDGVFRTPDGDQRCYIATDAYNDELLVGMTSKDFLHILQDEHNANAMKLRWDDEKKIGVIFHILDFIPLGKIGFTAIGESLVHARHFFDIATEFLKSIALAKHRQHT